MILSPSSPGEDGSTPSCILSSSFIPSEVCLCQLLTGASQVALAVKTPPANAGDVRDAGSMSGSGRSPGGQNGNPLQYSCLENPMDRGAWRAIVHKVAKSRTQLNRQCMHASPLPPAFYSQFLKQTISWSNVTHHVLKADISH